MVQAWINFPFCIPLPYRKMRYRTVSPFLVILLWSMDKTLHHLVSCIKSWSLLSSCISSPPGTCICEDLWRFMVFGLMIDSGKHIVKQTKWLDIFWRLPRHSMLQCGITVRFKKHVRMDLLVKHFFSKAQLVSKVYIELVSWYRHPASFQICWSQI